jgi:hypothetical protein
MDALRVAALAGPAGGWLAAGFVRNAVWDALSGRAPDTAYLADLDLVHHAEALAREKGIPRVFALTTRAADFFEKRVGYSPCDADELPTSRRQQLEESGRDSKIFEKVL